MFRNGIDDTSAYGTDVSHRTREQRIASMDSNLGSDIPSTRGKKYLMRCVLFTKRGGLLRHLTRYEQTQVDVNEFDGKFRTAVKCVLDSPEVVAVLDQKEPDFGLALRFALQHIVPVVIGPNAKVIHEAEELSLKARVLSKGIFDGQTELRNLLDAHWIAVSRRWNKYQLPGRERVLRSAWPNMIPARLSKDPVSGSVLVTESDILREAYMWPYINLEDLVSGDRLLLFMESRSRKHPSVFVHSDLLDSKSAVERGVVDINYLDNNLMRLDAGGDGKNTRSEYGRLETFSRASRAEMETLLLSGAGFLPGEGMLILEIQERIMRFLLDCCRGILYDTTEVKRLHETPLATLAAEVSYRNPSETDLHQLQQLVSAHHFDAEESFWALREDPDFFADAILDITRHLRDEEPQERDLVMSRHVFAVRKTLRDTYGDIVIWRELELRIAELAKESKNSFEKLTSQGLLSPCEAALFRLKDFLMYTIQYFASQLEAFAIEIETQEGFTVSYALHDCIADSRNDVNLSISLVGDVETILTKDAYLRSYILPAVTKTLEKLFVACESLRQLRLYQPYIPGLWRNDGECNTQLPVLDTIFKASEVDKCIFDLVYPLQPTFAFPVYERQTCDTTEVHPAAHDNLKRFWDQADAFFEDVGRQRPYELLKDYVAHRQIRNESLSDTTVLEGPQTLPQASSTTLNLDIFTVSLNSPSTSPPSTISTSPSVQQQQQQPLHAPKQLIKLQRQNIDVIRALFLGNARTEIKWVSFLGAMEKIGFGIQPVKGSSYQFTYPINHGKSILIHKPHPRQVISKALARNIGNKLTRAYGLTADRFEGV
ncbi:hypothetical protein F4813DRAFT_396151 [Daldinia decipiens]|uniref:uncharacterized protein n=1 Tax=Daldinia decipiens TaxID=326647 RepID=UPI0020C24514|nr:uncharacterized protein F4813DRAFT_396151 [Daldinia decipiens]KAI1657630.1 hypothetical protein F4813DRAFT_396151 [Daldinia decipiens]